MAQRVQRGMTTVRAPRILTKTPQLDSARAPHLDGILTDTGLARRQQRERDCSSELLIDAADRADVARLFATIAHKKATHTERQWLSFCRRWYG